jgi:hypothetical protein
VTRRIDGVDLPVGVAAARAHRDRLRLPTRATPLALAGLAVLSVVPLRGHALTYLAGGPVIAVLTAAVLPAWRTRTEVTQPALRALVRLGTVSDTAYLRNCPLTLRLRQRRRTVMAA